LITNDHTPWIKYWDRLKYSSEILKKNIENVFKSMKEANTSEIPEIKATIEAYMLLLGYSQENLIKGALMKKHYLKFGECSFKNFKEIKQNVWKNVDGHSLIRLIEKNEILAVYKAERNLLSRIEEYIKWAGRYEYSLNLEERNIEILKKIEVHDWDDDIISQFEWRIFEKIKNGW
jgi:hypothetical protein